MGDDRSCPSPLHAAQGQIQQKAGQSYRNDPSPISMSGFAPGGLPFGNDASHVGDALQNYPRTAVSSRESRSGSGSPAPYSKLMRSSSMTNGRRCTKV